MLYGTFYHLGRCAQGQRSTPLATSNCHSLSLSLSHPPLQPNDARSSKRRLRPRGWWWHAATAAAAGWHAAAAAAAGDLKGEIRCMSQLPALLLGACSAAVILLPALLLGACYSALFTLIGITSSSLWCLSSARRKRRAALAWVKGFYLVLGFLSGSGLAISARLRHLANRPGVPAVHDVGVGLCRRVNIIVGGCCRPRQPHAEAVWLGSEGNLHAARDAA